jgi:hypothetical protein
MTDGNLKVEPHLSPGWGRVRLENIPVGVREATIVRP